MRVLVINPNTTVAVTESIVAEARRVASQDIEITGVSARFGSPFIQTPEESATAAEAVLELVARLAPGFDAVVIAAFSDPGLDAARAVSPVPVVGIAESAMLTALLCGGRFAIVTLGSALKPVLEQAARRLGCADRLSAIHALDLPAGAADGARRAATVQHDHGATLAGLCRRAAATEGVRSIILGGGPLAGLAHRIRDQVQVPLLDGTACAISHAATLVRLGVRYWPEPEPRPEVARAS
ncbi:aspartate/glutamate racemase family protein [Skermanella sp. TT6]|uniref:Aspartate/glutamate racemase family protein n=1 Tax=Skermanella cutis TaxID=2775420 RepID=A0ABX7BBW3_9PROT|nr:aspartate/glutamate racemase family protein [Skermanella sp. TT6]QQP91882.1 aspartate/glutamate racemase family protein [Skermanella sp. TT6]